MGGRQSDDRRALSANLPGQPADGSMDSESQASATLAEEERPGVGNRREHARSDCAQTGWRARPTTASSAASRHRPGSHLSSGRCGHSLGRWWHSPRPPRITRLRKPRPGSALPATRWLGQSHGCGPMGTSVLGVGGWRERTSRLPGAGGSVWIDDGEVRSHERSELPHPCGRGRRRTRRAGPR
jgi:hypothetical protein